MTAAFFIPVQDGDRTVYKSTNDKIRGVFEVITFSLAIIYALSEIDEMRKYDFHLPYLKLITVRKLRNSVSTLYELQHN